MIWHIIWLIILGLIVGIVARLVVPGRHPLGVIATALLGMTSHRLGREILSLLALDGFTTASPDLYESTAEKWRLIKQQS